jgi:hypothetical protein
MGADARLDRLGFAERVGLGIGHRVGSLGLLVLLGGVAAMVAGKSAGTAMAARYLLLAAFACGDLGLLSGMGSWWTARMTGRATGESRGVIVFNLIVLVVAAMLLVYRRVHHG